MVLTIRITTVCGRCSRRRTDCLSARRTPSGRRLPCACARPNPDVRPGNFGPTIKVVWRFGSDRKNLDRSYKEPAMMAQGYWRPGGTWPLSNATSSARLGSNDESTLAELINRRYDSSMYSRFVEEYYEGSGFHNYGYWTSET